MNSEFLSKFEKDLAVKELDTLAKEVENVVFHRVTKRTLVCVVTTKTGYESHGIAKVRNENQFDRHLGELYALKHALRYVINIS